MHCLLFTFPVKLENRPLSVNSQSGGQNNKIVLHLKRLFLSGNRTTIVLSSRLGITEMGLLVISRRRFAESVKENNVQKFIYLKICKICDVFVEFT